MAKKNKSAYINYYDDSGVVKKKESVAFWSAHKDNPPVLCVALPYSEEKKLNCELLIDLKALRKVLKEAV